LLLLTPLFLSIPHFFSVSFSLSLSLSYTHTIRTHSLYAQSEKRLVSPVLKVRK
jgi:hypothetical protein